MTQLHEDEPVGVLLSYEHGTWCSGTVKGRMLTTPTAAEKLLLRGLFLPGRGRFIGDGRFFQFLASWCDCQQNVKQMHFVSQNSIRLRGKKVRLKLAKSAVIKRDPNRMTGCLRSCWSPAHTSIQTHATVPEPGPPLHRSDAPHQRHSAAAPRTSTDRTCPASIKRNSEAQQQHHHQCRKWTNRDTYVGGSNDAHCDPSFSNRISVSEHVTYDSGVAVPAFSTTVRLDRLALM